MATAALAPDTSAPVSRPARITGTLRTLPLLLVMTYLCLVFLAFLLWPINWSIYYASQWLGLTAYILLCYAVICLCYLGGTRRIGRPTRALKAVPLIIVAGAIATVILLFPLSRVYTGNWPWQVFEAAAQQGDAYRSLQDQLQETAGQRGWLVVLRAVCAPLTYAVLPLGIVAWGRLNWFQRGCVIAAVMATMILSFMRGTDREFADMFIIGSSALLVGLGRFANGRLDIIPIVKRYWLPALMAVLFIFVASTLFTERKSARLGGFETRGYVCANESRICANLDEPMISWMPLQQRFGISIFVLSSASGYYGLALAMEKDFKSSYGLGHSPATLAVYELATGDQSIYRRTYTYRNGFDGWSDANYWSTLITWIANDVGFVGAVFVLGLLGFACGKLWTEAAINRSDSAAVLFTITMMMLFYLPANNQFFGSYDGYFVAPVWLALWLRDKTARKTLALPGR